MLALCSLTLVLHSCLDEDFITDSGAALEFSVDTLSFDTVFTQRGSATRSFKVYNRHSSFIKVDRVWLEQGAESRFRMNVDGLSGIDISNLEIPPNDSVYVFVEVTVDPDQPLSVSPFVLGEWVRFRTNGNEQQVYLEAWGQNANYLPSLTSAGQQSLFTCRMSEWLWDDPRPYVVFGVLAVDSCTLVMPAGTRVYVHGGFGRTNEGALYNDGVLYFFRHGKLRIEGTAEQPVVIQGDRLESEFAELPGQWGRIQLGPRSSGNRISHAVIRNAGVGVLVDSLADLIITNSQIYQTSSAALAGYNGRISAVNCLFHTSGGHNVALILGGFYRFNYCTLANYGTATEALSASNFVCLDGTPLCSQPSVARLDMQFLNSIIYSSSRDAIALNDAVGPQDPSFFRYLFEHCVVRVDQLLDERRHPDFFDRCNACINGNARDPLFVSPDERNFRLDSLSIALNVAKPLPDVMIDIEGKLRDSEQPDAGCFERDH